jgi:hypothetical protein
MSKSPSTTASCASPEKQEQREENERGYRLSERSYGSFRTGRRASFAAQADKIKARFKNGVLTVTVPRDERRRPRAKSRSSAVSRLAWLNIQGGASFAPYLLQALRAAAVQAKGGLRCPPVRKSHSRSQRPFRRGNPIPASSQHPGRRRRRGPKPSRREPLRNALPNRAVGRRAPRPRDLSVKTGRVAIAKVPAP